MYDNKSVSRPVKEWHYLQINTDGFFFNFFFKHEGSAEWQIYIMGISGYNSEQYNTSFFYRVKQNH